MAYRLEIAAKSLPGVQRARSREVPGLTNGCSRRNCLSPETGVVQRGSSRMSSNGLHPLEILSCACLPYRFVIAAFVFPPSSLANAYEFRKCEKPILLVITTWIDKDICRHEQAMCHNRHKLTWNLSLMVLTILVKQKLIF